MGLAMKNVKLEATVTRKAVYIQFSHRLACRFVCRCQFERGRLRAKGSGTDRKKHRTIPRAVGSAVYLLGRAFYILLFKQSRNRFSLDNAVSHPPLHRLDGGFFARHIRLRALLPKLVHPPHQDTHPQLPESIRCTARAILGFLPLDIKNRHYTTAERNFFEDKVLNIHPARRAGIQAFMPGGAQ